MHRHVSELQQAYTATTWMAQATKGWHSSKPSNQITNSGYIYNARGNLTSDGVNTYVWDRANRLLSRGSTSYAYDGLGNRITATASGVTTRHLLDMQPGLTQVIASTIGANVTRTVHAPHGVFAQKDSTGNWESLLSDGLGSVRRVVSNAGSVLEHRHFDPFGNLYAGTMAQTDFGFTGEQFDAATGLLYLRARHYRPGISSFVSRDPFEGTMARPMSRNGYSWVEGRVADGRDPSGMLLSGSCTEPSTVSTELYRLSRVAAAAQSSFNVLRSSVVWALIRKSGGCETSADVWMDRATHTGRCVRHGLSIGTVIDRGILTHNHLTGQPDAAAMLSAISSYDWLYIEGTRSTDLIPIEMTRWTGSFPETVLIQLPYRANHLGDEANIGDFRTLQRDSEVVFPYYPEHGDGWYNFWGGYPRHDTLVVGTGKFWKLEPGYSAVSFSLQEPRLTGPGDSGGGYFNTEGNLIGVLRAQGEVLPDTFGGLLHGLNYYFKPTVAIVSGISSGN